MVNLTLGNIGSSLSKIHAFIAYLNLYNLRTLIPIFIPINTYMHTLISILFQLKDSENQRTKEDL